jgi:hypothetical protein
MSPQVRTFCGLVPTAALLCGTCFAAQPEQAVGYHLEPTTPLSRFTSHQRALLSKLNRADAAHLGNLRQVIVPNRWETDELLFSPMPREVPQLSDEKKAVLVDLAAQVFGAFEYGKLVRWGPVSSGDSRHRTPSGTYHLNWHSRVRISSEDPTWIMPWYFNFESRQGIGMHQYTLPGRPASHGCVRMLAVDAKWLFDWGDGWQVDPDTREVVQEGTLVLVIGSYDFGAGQPWLKPSWWARGITLPLQQLANAR